MQMVTCRDSTVRAKEHRSRSQLAEIQSDITHSLECEQSDLTIHWSVNSCTLGFPPVESLENTSELTLGKGPGVDNEPGRGLLLEENNPCSWCSFDWDTRTSEGPL